jgi:hypothetical protein
MQAALTSSKRPGLAGLTTRDDEDFTIALLDATACMADVLTFYSERLVNEAFLRTAKDRVSLAELGRLIGYRLRPGVAASTHLAFHVEPPPPAAVDAATTPFRKIRMPESVTIPAGAAVRSVPGPGEQQQVFETSEAIEARPPWNLMPAVTTEATVLNSGAKSMYVKGLATNLRPGDLLLFSSASAWEVRPIGSAVTQPDRDRTLVSWKDALTKTGPLNAHIMRKKLNFFGYNAPSWKSMSADFKEAYGCSTGCDEWPLYYSSPLAMTSDMDGSHPDIAVGSRLVFAAAEDRSLFTALEVTELSRAEFAMSGKVTRVKLSGSSYSRYDNDVRGTAVFAVEEPLVLAEQPITSNVSGGQIVVAGNVTSLPKGRTLLVCGGGKVETMTLESATAAGASTTLTFTGDLAHSYDPASLVVFGNVAKASHGETVHQILGDGQAARPFQRFELKHAPLTYVQSGDPAGSSSTLEVRVNEVAWHELPTLYRAKPGDRVFVTRDSTAGTVEVGTGDGRRGARVPTGQHNVRAVYRKGIGAGGNLPAGALTQLGSPPLGVSGVTNPVPAAGGADSDSAGHARTRIPLSARTLGRAVSLSDYADFAQTFAGIAKAHAVVVLVRNVRTIVVTVAGQSGAVVPDQVLAGLCTALRSYGDPLVSLLVVPQKPVSFQLRMKVRRDPDHVLGTVLKAVASRLTQAFGFAAREFTQPVQRSEVIAAAHRAPGVVAVDLDYLWRGYPMASHLRLLAAGPQINGSQVDGAELLQLTADPLPWLTEMPS